MMSGMGWLGRVMVAGTLGLAGCTLILGADKDYELDSGSGGATSSGSGGATVSSSSGQGGCMCPPPPNECIKATCEGGVCGTMNEPQGTVPATQVTGDCKRDVCDGNGVIETINDDADVDDDAKDCTIDTCSNGVPLRENAPPGFLCDDDGGAACNNMGACVECINNAECTPPEVCQTGNCVPQTCVSAMKDGNETDIDCGGPDCNPCTTGKDCMMNSDCVSAVCSGGKCQVAACNDMVKNGNETDIDCGGSDCPKCANNQMCSAGSDCISGVCLGGICQEAPCSNMMKDGDETDVDCGGSCPVGCSPGQTCVVADDCVNGTTCSGGLCTFVHGCDPAMATDQTGMQKATITSMGLAYAPKCLKVSAGTDVTWNSNFTIHPLVGGEVVGVTMVPDPNSPIKPTSTGMTVTFKLSVPGAYGYYCNVHGTAGMNGVIFVE